MSREHFVTSQYNKGVYGMSGQAFGVGALEEDDDDIFSQESVTSYHTSLALPSDNEQPAKYGWTGGKEMGENWSLSSFNKSSTRHKYIKVYAPPTVPQDFVPVHKFVTASSSKPTDEKPALSVTERGFLTGDKSVFDLISPQDRARLKRVKEGKTFPIDTHKPYGSKHSQQEDHDHKDSKLSTISSRPVSSASEERQLIEWEKQKEEFERLTQVYRPLATALSDRFTRGSGQEEVGEREKDVNPADVEMFGLMTREISDWHPHRVLCKRFNIPDPYPNSDIVGVPQKSKSSLDWREQMRFERSLPEDPPATSRKSTYSQEQQEMETSLQEKETKSLSDQEHEEAVVPEQELEPEVEEGRPVTLLKSIFEEEDSSSEEEKNDEVQEEEYKEEEMEHNQPEDQPHPQLLLRDQPHPKESDHVFKSSELLILKMDQPPLHESRTGQTHPQESREKQWKNFADVIKPTLSSPQKPEKPIVYV